MLRSIKALIIHYDNTSSLSQLFGHTEAELYFVQYHDEFEWYYYWFCASIGLAFESRTEDLYEAVFYRKARLER